MARVKRLRGRTLQRIRTEHLRRNPLCANPFDKPDHVALAVELDHRVPLHKGGEEHPSNRQGLCAECHLEKSKRERGHAYKPRVKTGTDGYPL